MEQTKIHVRVLLFSVLRERVGQDEVEVALDPHATGEDVLQWLLDEQPALAPYRPHIRLAVNEAYQPTTAVLRDGDEVALITPVSGG